MELKVDGFLKSIEFFRSEADPSVYVAQVGDVKFFIMFYVDDPIFLEILFVYNSQC
jgi:hypothetical protein